MTDPIVPVQTSQWSEAQALPQYVEAVEAGQVLYFPRLRFTLSESESKLLRPDVRDPAKRNISQAPGTRVVGAVGSTAEIDTLDAMMLRFRNQATQLVDSLFPMYHGHLAPQPTSFRPSEVESRAQSWRADDKRLHVDSFPSRPNRGMRILRVFTNLNPNGVPRVWRVGEPFEAMARHFMPRIKRYSPLQAAMLNKLHVTKSLRSEYDHMMLQLHDLMKSDMDYQRNAEQTEFGFPPGSSWVCFSDQTLHAVHSGQFMMEQTYFMQPQHQARPERSPLGILTRMKGRALEGAPL